MEKSFDRLIKNRARHVPNKEMFKPPTPLPEAKKEEREKSPSKEISPFSPKTNKFIASWLTAGEELEAKDLTRSMKREVRSFQDRYPVLDGTTLYRGLKADDTVHEDEQGRKYVEFKWLSSWTYNSVMAGNFSEWKVVKTSIDNADVFLDTINLFGDPFDFILSGNQDEEEVILQPGRYYLEEDISPE